MHCYFPFKQELNPLKKTLTILVTNCEFKVRFHVSFWPIIASSQDYVENHGDAGMALSLLRCFGYTSLTSLCFIHAQNVFSLDSPSIFLNSDFLGNPRIHRLALNHTAVYKLCWGYSRKLKSPVRELGPGSRSGRCVLRKDTVRKDRVLHFIKV